MIYQSDALSVKRLDGDIAELNFDRQGESVNKFDQQTVTNLTEALDALEAESGIRGLLVTSGKPVFIVGADITEFTSLFGAGKDEIKPFTGINNANFNRLQNLPYPSCAVINGAWPATSG
jgi:3-hydroxyacyl-CoA dehydrogenase/enoyl-CoA hydratase/3-hydroxybutyryl-CoA epimerase/enoyl-CoA isomerase